MKRKWEPPNCSYRAMIERRDFKIRSLSSRIGRRKMEDESVGESPEILYHRHYSPATRALRQSPVLVDGSRYACAGEIVLPWMRDGASHGRCGSGTKQCFHHSEELFYALGAQKGDDLGV